MVIFVDANVSGSIPLPPRNTRSRGSKANPFPTLDLGLDAAAAALSTAAVKSAVQCSGPASRRALFSTR